MNKIYESVSETVADIPDNAVVAIGGFFTCGNPGTLIDALAVHGAKKLTLITQSMGVGNWEINHLLENKQVSKAICNYPFYRSASKISLFEKMLRNGDVECEVSPMGTFIERLRAAGAGIPAFYTPTGVGTVVAKGKETRVFNGSEYLLEEALKPDFALIHAYKADPMGNIIFRKTAQNYNPEMAKAATVAIAEVEEIVETGDLDPDCIHLPGIYVQRIVRVPRKDVVISIDD